MRLLLLIALLFTSLCGQQSPEEWWYGKYNSKGKLIEAGADSLQKDFARWNYEYGKTFGRGHTLTCLSQSEGSLRRSVDHGDEDSYGPYGVGLSTATSTLILHNLQCPNPGDLSKLLQFDLEYSARIALLIFEDNINYFRNKGYSERESWFWAYPRYCAGKKWWRFRKRGEVFNARVRFLKKEFK